MQTMGSLPAFQDHDQNAPSTERDSAAPGAPGAELPSGGSNPPPQPVTNDELIQLVAWNMSRAYIQVWFACLTRC